MSTMLIESIKDTQREILHDINVASKPKDMSTNHTLAESIYILIYVSYNYSLSELYSQTSLVMSLLIALI